MNDKDLVGNVEVHVKYMGEWLTMGQKKNVKDTNLGQAINLIATEIQLAIENAVFNGEVGEFVSGKIGKDGTIQQPD